MTYLRQPTPVSMHAPMLFFVIPITFAAIPPSSFFFQRMTLRDDMSLHHDVTAPATWDAIEDNKQRCETVRANIQDIIMTQRAASDSEEYWALEQRFIDLVMYEDKLRKEQVDLIMRVKPKKYI